MASGDFFHKSGVGPLTIDGSGSSTGAVEIHTVGIVGGGVVTTGRDISFDIRGGTFVNGVNTIDENPEDVIFSDDGTKMLILGRSKNRPQRTDDVIRQFTLSTPFDITTAVFDKQVQTASREARGLAWNDDGTVLYEVDTIRNFVIPRAVSTPYDLSPTEYFALETYREYDDETAEPYAVTFSADGTIMVLYDDRRRIFVQYDLSTPFALSTATLTDKRMEAFPSNTRDITFADNGNKFFETNLSGDQFIQYNLGTAFDITTAEKVAQHNTRDSTVNGFDFNGNGTKLFEIGSSGRLAVHTLTSPYELDTAIFDFEIFQEGRDFRDIVFKPDGTSYYLVDSDHKFNIDEDRGEFIIQHNVENAFDIKTSDHVIINTRDSTPSDIAFNDDGTKLFETGRSGDNVYSRSLSTPYRVGTATDLNTFSVSSQESNPTGLEFSAIGDRMYIVGSSSDSVHQYNLSTNFDISTASFDTSLDVSNFETSPNSVAVSNDGSKLFVGGSQMDGLMQWNLSSNFDIGTASFEKEVNIEERDPSVQGLTFNDVGSKMYTTSGRELFQYSMAVPFDIGTLEFEKSIKCAKTTGSDTRGIVWNGDGTVMVEITERDDDIITRGTDTPYDIEGLDKLLEGRDNDVYGIAFNGDGTKLYEVGQTEDILFEYNLGTAYEITTAYPEALKGTGVDIFRPTEDSYSSSPGDRFNLLPINERPNPEGIAFASDGSKIFITHSDPDEMFQFDLATPYDLSTATLSGSIRNRGPSSTDVITNDDGTKMYEVDQSDDVIRQFALTTPNDITTAVFEGEIDTQDASPTGIAWSSDGSRFFEVGRTQDRIYQYDTLLDILLEEFPSTGSSQKNKYEVKNGVNEIQISGEFVEVTGIEVPD